MGLLRNRLGALSAFARPKRQYGWLPMIQQERTVTTWQGQAILKDRVQGSRLAGTDSSYL
jgi:hypothetical protein